MQQAPESGASAFDRTGTDDWITIWESECRALAADRELREAMEAALMRGIELAGNVAAWLEIWQRCDDAAAGGVSGAGTQARTAAPAASPDDGGTTIGRPAGGMAELGRPAGNAAPGEPAG